MNYTFSLGLITIAALLPQKWELNLVDCNIRAVTEDQWSWADLVIVLAMIVQKEDFCDQIQEAKKRGKAGVHPSFYKPPQAISLDGSRYNGEAAAWAGFPT